MLTYRIVYLQACVCVAHGKRSLPHPLPDALMVQDFIRVFRTTVC